MTKENIFAVGTMHIELFLPSEQIGRNAIIPRMTHGLNIVTMRSGNEDVTDCDALITENLDISLGIRTADCAPTCFSDGKKIGVAHIGWRGLCLGFIEKMTENFDTTNLSIYVAPFLHSFEIHKDFCYEQIVQKFGERYFSEKDKKLIFNFKDAISSLLPPQTVYDARDTGTDLSLPSYRRKDSGRFTTVVSFI